MFNVELHLVSKINLFLVPLKLQFENKITNKIVISDLSIIVCSLETGISKSSIFPIFDANDHRNDCFILPNAVELQKFHHILFDCFSPHGQDANRKRK